MKNNTPILVLVLLALLPAFALAAKPVDPVNRNKEGLAVKGYDVVAYFTEGQPTEGSSDYRYEWQDATWQFANADHLAAFEADPERYAPQYGGYCSYAVSKGGTAGISVKAWTIVDDKLYLNHKLAQGKFRKNAEKAIERADANWPDLAKKPLP